MSKTETALTPAQAQVFLRWLTKHLSDYVNNFHNNALLGTYLRERQLPLTEENLEAAYVYLNGRFEFSDDPAAPLPPPETEPVPPAQTYPWETPLTETYFKKLTGKQFLAFMKFPAFAKQARAAGLMK